MSTSPVPVLGMILKGYPRISETFISNEILLLENLGFTIHLFSMRQPREDFSHESVKKNPGQSGLFARNTDKALAATAVSQPPSGCKKTRGLCRCSKNSLPQIFKDP